MFVAVLTGGAGSQLPVDAWIRVGVVVAVLVIVLRASLTRLTPAT
ncbi:hypothetical protein ACFV7Q_18705 [Streptomyces sp. NPDC059851]